MASTLQKLFRRSMDARSIASLLDSHSPKLVAPQIVRSQIHIETESRDCDKSNARPLFELPKAYDLTRLQSSLFYPTFPLGFHLKPISSYFFRQSEGNDKVSSDSGMLWADSVKKKRKKKMNKHKYQKLRKRIRRQT